MSTDMTDTFSELNNSAEAKMKTDAQTTINIADVFSIPKPIGNRVFINHVDSFCGKHISAFLTDQIRGALKSAGEGDEGEEEEEEEQKTPRTANFAEKYEIIGTLRYPHRNKSEDVLYIVNDDDEDFLNEIMRCAFVVYDITGDRQQISKALDALTMIEKEIEKLKEVGPKTFKDYTELRVFVLISTVMTWALTKPIDPDDPETPFNETDYKKRKPHPNYKEHIACEREVMLRGRKYKDKLRTFVVCSGIVYGEEEEDLEFFFKLAWKNEEFLPIYQPGNNSIPLIHVTDLCRVIHGILEAPPKKPKYILAVEQTPCTLKQIVKGLSKALGKDKVREIPKEEAFLNSDMTQTVFERCTVNLHMEPGFIVDDLELEWKNELNLAENIVNIANEFRTSRKLIPIRVVMHGPPAVGKTGLAFKLCEVYGTQHVTVKSMIEDTLKNLREKISAEKAKQQSKENRDEEEGEEEAEEEQEADFAEEIRDIEGAIAASENGRLLDDYVVRLLKKYLSSNRCQNQGYILDGYPKTFAQAKQLFGESPEEGEEEAEEEEDGGTAKPSKILPDHVITLEATDEFICERLMNLPEKEIQGTSYTEENILRRLTEFRRVNTEDDTVLNFFDEIEIHPIVINVELTNVEDLLRSAVESLGSVMGLAPTLEEEAEMLRCEEDMRRLKQEEQALEAERLELLAVESYQNTMEEWTSTLEKLQMEEEKLMVAESEPLRNYLMKFVFPTLTKGLLEVARMKPRDPVDFLAEYLFRENPEGHMFDPSYTRSGEVIMQEQKAPKNAYKEAGAKLNDSEH